MSFYQGGSWTDFGFDKEPREPKIKITHATDQLVKLTLTDTDPSMANMLRRIIMAEVPTMAIDIVNIEDNDSVLFDEFIAHRMGMFPLASHAVGDIPPDLEWGYREHKDCNCFDGCPYCTVEFKMDVVNEEDKVLNVTHFDLKDHGIQREKTKHGAKVEPVPFRDTNNDYDQETKDNGILVVKLKKDQRLRMICQARKGIPKYHAKFMPVATCVMRYQPIIKLDQECLDGLSLDKKIEFVESCPRKVFDLTDDKVKIARLDDCIFCDECEETGKRLGLRKLAKATQNTNMFHYTIESVTPHGPRSVIDVVRAALRVFDYKLRLFLKDTFGDEITDHLPYEKTARTPTIPH